MGLQLYLIPLSFVALWPVLLTKPQQGLRHFKIPFVTVHLTAINYEAGNRY